MDPIVLDLPACGLRAFAYWGMYLELNRSVHRIYGRSSGAIVGACILCIEPDSIEEVYTRVCRYNKTLYIVDSWCKVLLEMLPGDAYLRCTGRLFVTCAIWGCISRTTSIFTDNAHLVNTLYTSGSIPLITTGARIQFHGWCPAFDGGFIDVLYPRRIYGARDSQVLVVAIPPSTSWPDRIARSTLGHSLSVVHDSIEQGRSLVRSFLLLRPDEKTSAMAWRLGRNKKPRVVYRLS
jgi:hypothetical protein